MNDRRQRFFGILALLLAAVVWGVSFSAQRRGLEVLGPAIFNALRSLIGAVALLPVIAAADRIDGTPFSLFGAARSREERRALLTGSSICGIALTVATLLQQWGLTTTGAGKAGFLSSLYLVLVPLFGIPFGRKNTLLQYFAVAAGLAGMLLLCAPSPSEFALRAGDWYLIGCAAAYAVHIVTASFFAPRCDCLRMACLQFLAAAFFSLLFSLAIGEAWSAEAIRRAAGPLLFCGVCSSGIGFTMQLVGQKYVHPTAASLLMSLESVFAALGGWLLLDERLTPMELAGCTVIFFAAMLAQFTLPARRPR